MNLSVVFRNNFMYLFVVLTLVSIDVCGMKRSADQITPAATAQEQFNFSDLPADLWAPIEDI